MSSTASASSSSSSSSGSSKRWPIEAYEPRHASWPYTPSDFRRADETPDIQFYGPPRFVNHIDDHAIGVLGEYYASELPKKGRILDLCSSWVSHFPPELEKSARATAARDTTARDIDRAIDSRSHASDSAALKDLGLEVIGMGMNQAELSANPILSSSHLVDLNTNPSIPSSISDLDATVCVVSIDYLTQPLEVLSSVRAASKQGARVHLVLSNRCFPTKAIGRWLRISEEERAAMVGDYLWFSGWRDIEIVSLVKLTARSWLGGGDDPLWVVRGTKTEA